jgi:hypothetical protein
LFFSYLVKKVQLLSTEFPPSFIETALEEIKREEEEERKRLIEQQRQQLQQLTPNGGSRIGGSRIGGSRIGNNINPNAGTPPTRPPMPGELMWSQDEQEVFRLATVLSVKDSAVTMKLDNGETITEQL